VSAMKYGLPFSVSKPKDLMHARVTPPA
jgi:hypothetical protein